MSSQPEAIVTFNFDTHLPSTLPPPREDENPDENFEWYSLSQSEFEKWVADFLTSMASEEPWTSWTFSFYLSSRKQVVWVTIVRINQVFSLSFAEKNVEKLPFEVELYGEHKALKKITRRLFPSTE